MTSFLQDYLLIYVDYENNNPLLNSLLIPTFGAPNVSIIPISSIKSSFLRVDTKICKECGETGDECGCTVKNFFKMEIINEDYFIYKRAEEVFNTVSTTKNGFVIFKSTTTTNQLNFDFTNTLLTENFNSDIDLFYFAKWLDKKETMKTLKIYPNSTRYISTLNPIGIQAVLFSKACIEKIKAFPPVGCRPFSLFLLSLIKEGTLTAHSTFPCLFNFDCLTAEYKINWNDNKAIYDYLKNCEIQGTVFPEEPLNRRFSNDIIFFWLFIVIVIVGITVFIIKQNN